MRRRLGPLQIEALASLYWEGPARSIARLSEDVDPENPAGARAAINRLIRRGYIRVDTLHQFRGPYGPGPLVITDAGIEAYRNATKGDN